jgi:hypothetical protein
MQNAVDSAIPPAPPLFKCAGPSCPGLPYQASQVQGGHPASCAVDPPLTAEERRAKREAEDVEIHGIRVQKAAEALEVLGFVPLAARMWAASASGRTYALKAIVVEACAVVQTRRKDLADGSDEARRIDLGTALDLLGSLWCVS